MSELLKKLQKNSTIAESALLSKSQIYDKKEFVPTDVPMVNVALSGTLDGGLLPGLTMICGPSKHFKSAFGLLLASAYLKKYKDGILVFYDSEFGTPKTYFESFGIDPERVHWVPVTDVEELKQDIVKQLNNIEKGDHICIVLDSMGNLASAKEVEDTLSGKTITDMTRAKSLKSLFRMLVPRLNLKGIPMVTINHSYQTLEMFSKTTPGGGTGGIYGANDIWIIGRQQDKADKDLLGYHFIINIEKSRLCKEKSKIPVTVSFEGGIKKYSGLLELAEEGNFIAKPVKGKYQLVNQDTGELVGTIYKESEIIDNPDVWDKLLVNENFKTFINEKFTLGNDVMFSENESVKEND